MIDAWYTIILNPMLNGLIALSSLMPYALEFGLAIMVFTVVIRLILTPLTLRQLKSTRQLQGMQPKIQELQKKYAKNKEKLQKELAGVYKEAGVNPIGCIWPMLIQFPIWIALYQSIMRALGTTPENLLDLSKHLYSWEVIKQTIPLNSQFLWLDLAYPDPYLILAVLVAGTMWIQQKMTTPPSVDPRQQSTSGMMTLMMPLMFGMLTIMFPSGLALYWLVSNVIGVVTQYFLAGGWGYLRSSSSTQLAPPQGSKRAR